MKHILFFVCILTHSLSFSQVIDDFSDGDFTSNPVWTGLVSDYTVNGSFELQLNNTVASTSYLSLPHGLASLDNKEWHFVTRQTFAPSGSNYGRVYLTATSGDLTTDPDGFYLQFGEAGTGDAIRLFKVETGTHTEILAGPAAQIATSFSVGVKVLRDNTGNWSLYIDDTGGTNYTLVGSVNEPTVLLGTHFGLIDVYTASNATKFYYDDFYIGDEILNLDPPVLVAATPIGANLLDVQFDEALEQISAETVANYGLQPSVGISTATLDGTDPTLVHLTTASGLTNGTTYTLSTNAVADVSMNVSGSQSVNFDYLVAETPLPGDVVLNEFFCDPSPVVGLPEYEYVEIYNRSNKIFNVQDWKLGDASGDGTVLNEWLLPGEYLVLTSTTGANSFAGAVGVTSFPSLNNSGDNIVLRSDLGLLLDSITYSLDWYHDATKEDGGYAIERINPNDPCTDFSDWTASNDFSGGTPGVINSAYDPTPDTDVPGFDQIVAMPPNTIQIYFDEGMDSLSLMNAVINVTPALTIQNIYAVEEHPTMILIQFVESFSPSQVYTLEMQNVADCWMNTTTLTGQFALPDSPAEGDVVINEILFNPVTGGSDWVEVYNNSDKLFDLYQWELANFNNDTIDNHEIISTHFLLFPDSYAVVSPDSVHILQNFTAAVPGTFVQNALPTYGNDSGTVYLIVNNQVLDYVSYSKDWHFQLLDDEDGKSLERISPDGESNNSNNWHTAAEAIGFGTPGRVNSQYSPAITNGMFDYTSETISPDNDGFEDVLQVNYSMNAPGYIGSFTIYDDRGRLISKVMDSELLETEGTIIWQGITAEGNKASIGTYVGVFEAFDVDGGVVFTKRKAFVVAGML